MVPMNIRADAYVYTYNEGNDSRPSAFNVDANRDYRTAPAETFEMLTLHIGRQDLCIENLSAASSLPQALPGQACIAGGRVSIDLDGSQRRHWSKPKRLDMRQRYYNVPKSLLIAWPREARFLHMQQESCMSTSEGEHSN